MKYFAAAILAMAVQADQYTVERDSRIADVSGLTIDENNTETTDARYKNYIKYAVSTTDDANSTWNMWVKSVYKNDDGEVYLRILHELEADIAADKIVTFEFGFESASDPYIDRMNILQMDAAKCELIQNSQDTQFWNQQASDGHYLCDDELCSAPTYTWNADDSPSDLDWTNPVIDDEELAPFCTPHETDSANFACQKIICIHERPMITGYTDDFQFSVSTGGTVESPTYVDDTMTIPVTQGTRFGINDIDSASGSAPDADTAAYNTIQTEVSIYVLTGAMTMAASATLAAVSALVM